MGFVEFVAFVEYIEFVECIESREQRKGGPSLGSGEAMRGEGDDK